MSPFPRALFVSHGGGPLPLLGDPAHQELVACLQSLARQLPRPRAVVVVSAHWEASAPCITSSANPRLLYDYSGFPPQSYALQYPCPGSPSLAQHVSQQLHNAGLSAQLDSQRGLDHGVFVPLMLLYPQADIPVVQVSLVNNLDPGLHLALGRALRGLADQDILLLGSGFSFHNMRGFFGSSSQQEQALNREFEAWLHHTCLRTDIAENLRAEALRDWESAPGARYCHPREEHLLPLHVCYGAAQKPATARYALQVLGKESSVMLW